jgi:Peptidase_C39 like family
MNYLPLLLLGLGSWMAFLPGTTAGAAEVSQNIVIRVKPKKDITLDWLLDHPNLFTATMADFEKEYPKGTFTWLDKEKTRARFNPDRINMKLRGEESGETIVSFKESKINGVMMSVLNKGDDGFIKDGPFKKAVSSARSTLQAVAKVKEAPRKKNETISKADGLVWSTKQALYMLEYLWVPEESRDGYRWYAHGEFVRIRILPPSVLLGVQQNTMKTNISRPTLAKRVKKEGTKVWLEGIPMVDQGSKGYCAVASFERVMRYYGSQVDMHDLADLANTNSFGTSPDGIKDAVHKMAVRSGLSTREPVFMEGKDFVSLKNAYNREAKKQNLGIVEDPDGIMGLYREMDPDLFKAMRSKDSGLSKFGAEVARSINAGIPVMWALQLGMFWEERLEDSYEASRGADGEDEDEDEDEDEETTKPAADKNTTKSDEETPPQRPKRPPEHMSGGHMRIILGYDPKQRLIYYSDSWGPGHEMKQMGLEEAWAVTMGLFIVEPR